MNRTVNENKITLEMNNEELNELIKILRAGVANPSAGENFTRTNAWSDIVYEIGGAEKYDELERFFDCIYNSDMDSADCHDI